MVPKWYRGPKGNTIRVYLTGLGSFALFGKDALCGKVTFGDGRQKEMPVGKQKQIAMRQLTLQHKV